MEIPYQQNLERLAKLAVTDVSQLIPMAVAYVVGVSDKMDQAPKYEQIVVNTCENWKDNYLALGIKKLVEGQGHYYGARFDKVIPVAKEAIAIFEGKNLPDLLGVAHMIMGGALRSIGEVDEAVNHLMLGGEYVNPNGEFGIYYGYSHYQLAEIYVDIKDYDAAEKCYIQTAKAANITHGKTLLFRSLNGLGNLFLSLKQYDKALDYFNRSLEIANVPTHTSRALCDLGMYYYENNDQQKAQENFSKSYELRLSIGLKDAAATSLIGWSKSCLAASDTNKALELIEEALSITLEYRAKSKTVQCYKIFSDIHSSKNNWEKAYDYLSKYNQLQDEMVSLKLQNIYKLKNKKIEDQKQSIEEAHKEIKDSINYAKRIQDAIMPSMEAMSHALGNSFVLYLPKDVIAGDFFWMEQNEDVVYYAAADCTGHGVPGAMVSVVCSNALSKAFLEEGIRETGELLDKTRDLVIAKLAKSGEEVKDGMDISLCAWNKKTNQLQWSGANNPLWILRKDAQEIEETKADKQPIGVSIDPKPFTTHNFQLNESDAVYIFTDGYQDQFGGPKGKKFKASQLKQLLIDNQHSSMSEQNELIKNTIQSWKGDLEQVDDVCVIGVKI